MSSWCLLHVWGLIPGCTGQVLVTSRPPLFWRPARDTSAPGHSSSEATWDALDTCLGSGPQPNLQGAGVSLPRAQRCRPPLPACSASPEGWLRVLVRSQSLPLVSWPLGMPLASLKDPLHSSPGVLTQTWYRCCRPGLEPTPIRAYQALPLPWPLFLFSHLLLGGGVLFVLGWQLSKRPIQPSLLGPLSHLLS